MQTALGDFLEARKDEIAETDSLEPASKIDGDKPILTGNAEYDKWELEETSKERDFGRHATHHYSRHQG